MPSIGLKLAPAKGAGAGVAFDIMWYTIPPAYAFLNKQYNLFKSDLSNL
jgi:hypothetical protein